MGTALQQAKGKSIQFNHFGCFLLLLFFALMRPASIWPSLPFSLAPLIIPATVILLFYKVKTTIGWKSVWSNYNVELSLTGLYFTYCLLSLLVNYEYYRDFNQFIGAGLSFLVIQSLFPLMILLFSLPQNYQGPGFANYSYKPLIFFLMVLFLFFITVWQFVDNESSFTLSQFFIAGNIGDVDNVRGVFAISTDLGAISGVCLIFTLLLLNLKFNDDDKIRKLGLVGVCLLFFTIGLCSGARIFVLTLLVFFVSSLVFLIKLKVRDFAFLGVVMILCFILLSLIIPVNTAQRLSNIIPAIAPLNAGIPIFWEQLIPVLDGSALGSREGIWSNAVTVLYDKPFIGISGGAFRLLYSEENSHTHNFLLQSAVDGGIPALLIISCLLLRVIFRLRRHRVYLCFLLPVIFSSLVDYFADHSIPWIVIVAYLLTQLYRSYPQYKLKTNLTISCYEKKFLWAILLVFIVLLSIFQMKKMRLVNASVGESISMFLDTKVKYWESMPILVNQSMALAIEDGDAEEITRDLPIISDMCRYNYPGSLLIHPTGELKNDSIIELNETVSVSKISEVFKNCTYWDEHELHPQYWVSNLNSFLKNNQEEGVVIRYHHMNAFSPVFQTNEPIEFVLNVRGVPHQGEFPSLQLELWKVLNSERKLHFSMISSLGSVNRAILLNVDSPGLYFLTAKLYGERSLQLHNQTIYIESIEQVQRLNIN